MTRMPRPALTISLIYFVIGVVWIFTSDRINLPFVTDSDTLTMFQTVKGFFYVAVTAILLYFLVNRQIKRRNSLIVLLKHHNHLLQLVLEHQKGMNVLLVDKEGNILQSFGNDKLWGDLKTNELAGKNIAKWDVPDEEKQKMALFVRNIMIERADDLEIQIGGKWLRLSGVLSNEPGSERENEKLALIMTKDISIERKFTEESFQLKKQISLLSEELTHCLEQVKYHKEKILAIFNNIQEGVVIQEIEGEGVPGKIEELNNTASRYVIASGTKGNEIWKRVQFRSDKDKRELTTNNYLNRKQLTVFAEYWHSEGLTSNLEISSRFIFLNNKPRIVTVIRDITDMANTLQGQVTGAFDGLTILDSLSDGAMLIRPDLFCYYINDAMKNMFGIEWENGVLRLLKEMGEIGVDIEMLQNIDFALQGNISRTVDYQVETKPGKWYASTFYPIYNSENSVKSILCLTQEVTAKKDMEEFCLQQQSLVEESNQLKHIFLSNLSHEVRTPMNGILGFVELLEHDDLSETQSYYLQLIRQSCDNLLLILNSLVEVSSLENGQVTIENQWFKTEKLVEAAKEYANYRIKLSGKSNLDLRINVMPDTLPDEMLSDLQKMHEVMKLLIDNAIKFTTQGYVEIGFGSVLAGNFTFWVKDTGIGIKKRSRQSIFLPFASFSNSDQVLYGGIGLGLTIVKGLVNLLGGVIDLESEEGLGSCFTVSIPLKFQQGSANQSVNERNKGLSKVMIVQYGFESIKPVSRYLKQHNIEVLHANDGAEAIELFFSQKEIDAVFCDTRLSDMDGYEVLHAIRRMNQAIPIVAQAAYFIAEEKRRCLSEGFDDYLVKPIDNSLFFKTLKNL